MSDIPKPDYKQIVKDAGIPTDPAGWRKVLKEEMEKAGSVINNDSRFSPFWRMIEQAVITCTVWLVEKLLIGFVLPNMFLATASGQFLKQKAWGVDVTPKPANKAKGNLVFQRAALQGPALLIPAGTWVQTDIINGKIYRVKVQKDTVMPENATTVEAAVEAEAAGAAYNLGAGYFHVLPTPPPGIAAAANEEDWLMVAGADEENEDELRLRVRNQWSAVAQWHIDAAYRAILTEVKGIQTDNVFFEHGAPNGPGTANALILLDTGNPAPALIATLQARIDEGLHGHGDGLTVKAMPETHHDISVSVWPKPELTDAERGALQAQVRLITGSAFRENLDYTVTRTQPVGRFSFSRLEGELHTLLPGLESVKFAEDDIISHLTIPRLGALTVNLQG
ncbi:baseplate J/gp47 family protein [Grimontia sp. NTOU-MAR1]|uniref:baseplate J/gp47 family protein n=1 Tax=Grimontia sp. NTOU-MAR1 TaxID=3111011 RepID=UPI002DBC28DF|nr:baseplate J/gp47 family protein [Grimontia sp. NTOU-MAR1]WRV96525.1 baseplate J/gp47 family protein [Grimontia sp. NTOU-MAR1]